jgi:hypothetical protein
MPSSLRKNYDVLLFSLTESRRTSLTGATNIGVDFVGARDFFEGAGQRK